MIKMKGLQFLSIIIPILFLTLPKSEAFCMYDTSVFPNRHVCSNMNAEDLPTIVNLYLDSQPSFPKLDDLLLINNNISVIGDTLFTSEFSYLLHTLRIVKSNVEFIMVGSFEKLNDLTNLEITDNNLKSFDGMVLQGLDQLQTLHLQGNKLESLENICAAAPNLREIVIERNSGEIKNIPATVFQDCKNLVNLQLTGLGIENIESGFADNLPKLNQLNLTDNNLHSLKFLDNTKPLAINSLDVSKNHLTEVDAELFRVSLNRLSNLNLANNDISVFMKESNESFTFKLRSLNVTSNKISVINKNLFKYFSSDSFGVLNIDYNPIEKIEPDAFENFRLSSLVIKNSLQKLNYLKKGTFNNLKYISELDLSDANIVGIEKDTFKDLINLDTLYLQNNNITELFNGSFSSLNKVNVFNLTNNPVSVIEPGAFFGLSKVRHLEPKEFLTGVKRIQSKQFEGLSYNYLDKLDLSNLQIESLDELAFKGLFGLNVLRLDMNNISNLVENTFIGLDNLEKLNVSRSNLVTVNKNAFVNLSKLNDLDLSDNQISVLHKDTFNSLLRLRNLYISNNKLTLVESGMFKRLGSLVHLSLQDNMITYLKGHAFTGLRYLSDLVLTGNHIQKIDPGAFLGLAHVSDHIGQVFPRILELKTLEPYMFIGLDNLQYLDLSDKYLGNITSFAFAGVKSLGKLLLNNCSISVLSPNSFAGTYIQELHLANNNFSSIDSASFNDSRIDQLNLTGNVLQNINLNNFVSVRKLYLYNTSLKTVSNSRNYSGDMNIVLIDLRDNFITTLETDIFNNMKYLKELYLSGNPMKVIEGNSFLGLNDLKILTLSVINFKLNAEVFNGLKNMDEIVIQNSTINEIGIGTFSETNATILNFKMNRIDRVNSMAFSNMPGLTLLALSGNHLENIQKNSFHNLPSLKTLDLSNNNLQNLPCSIFSNLDRLENLYLNKNIIANLSPCSFKSFHGGWLRKLDLSFNSLNTIEEPGIFSPISGLYTLNLSSNALQFISDEELYHIRNVKSLDLSNNLLSGRMSYKNFEIGNWEDLELRNNNWYCGDLLDIQKLMRSKDKARGMGYSSYNRYDWEIDNEDNIDGITCRGPEPPSTIPPRTTTARSTTGLVALPKYN